LSQAELARVGGVAKAAKILVAVTAVAGLLNWVVAALVKSEAQQFLDREISSDDFASSLLVFSLVGVISGAATLGSAIVVMVWMHRIASNHRALHRAGTWGPGWAIGGWFLLPFVYVIPFLMFRELWKASDPNVPIGGDWKSGRVAQVVTAWFVVFGPISLVVQIASASSNLNLGTSDRDVAEQIVDSQALLATSGIVSIVAAGLFVVMATQLTQRHTRLTGEAAG
jgi:hypothetical protein